MTVGLRTFGDPRLLARFADRLQQRCDVAINEGECCSLWIGSRDLRHMVGHQHVLVANLLVDLDALEHVDAAFVGEHLHEVEFVSSDVSEVDVEDLFATAEVTDDVEDFFARIVEHLGHRALAEVETVIRALVHVRRISSTHLGCPTRG